MNLYQEGSAYPRRKSMGQAWKKGLRWTGNSLMGVGLFVLLGTGAYYGYSYYSLGQMNEELNYEAVQDVAPAPVESSEGRSAVLASSPAAATPALPAASTAGDDVPWEGLSDGPLGVFPA